MQSYFARASCSLTRAPADSSSLIAQRSARSPWSANCRRDSSTSADSFSAVIPGGVFGPEKSIVLGSMPTIKKVLIYSSMSASVLARPDPQEHDLAIPRWSFNPRNLLRRTG